MGIFVVFYYMFISMFMGLWVNHGRSDWTIKFYLIYFVVFNFSCTLFRSCKNLWVFHLASIQGFVIMPNISLQYMTTHGKPNFGITIYKIEITILSPPRIMHRIILQPKHLPIGNSSNKTFTIISNLI